MAAPIWAPGDIDAGTGINEPVSSIPKQAAKMGPCLPTIWGGGRPAGIVVSVMNVMDADIFSLPATTASTTTEAGKVADVVIAVCEAPIYTLSKIYLDGKAIDWVNRGRLLSADGTGTMEVITTEVDPNPAWSGYEGTAREGMKHEGTVYIRAKRLAFRNGKVPSLTFGVLGRGSGIRVDPATVAQDIFSDPRVGAGLPISGIDVDYGSDGEQASSYRRYCEATGLWVARVLDERKDSGELLKSLCDCTNSVPVPTTAPSGATVLRIVPRCDEVVVHPTTGVTYTPPGTAYTIDADEILNTSDNPVRVEQTEESEIFDLYPVQIRNELSGYEDAVYEWPGRADALPAGEEPRRAPIYRAEWLTHPTQAMALSRLMCEAANEIRNTFTVEVGSRLTALEPMDLCAITEGEGFGITAKAVRIAHVKDKSDGKREIVAEEWKGNISNLIDLTPQGHDGYDDVLPPPQRPQDGTPAVYVYLSNESHVLPADTAGAVTSYEGATTTMHVKVGDTDLSALWTFTKQDSAGVTSSIDGATVTITAMNAGTDSGFVDITATLGGGAELPAEFPAALVGSVFTRRFSLAKAKRGVPGLSGEGISRGPIFLQIAIAGTTWDSATATAQILAQGGGEQILGDRVTEYNSGAAWSETRAWDGSAWITYALYVDGNLITPGTIAAGALKANALQTTNYAEVATVPVAGAKLDHQGTALKVAAGNLQIGAHVFGERMRLIAAVTFTSTASLTFTLADWVDGDTLALAAFPYDYEGTPADGCFIVKRVYASLAENVGGRNRWTQGTIEIAAAPDVGNSVSYLIVLLRLET